MSGDKLVTDCHASQMQNVSVLWVGWKQDTRMQPTDNS